MQSCHNKNHTNRLKTSQDYFIIGQRERAESINKVCIQSKIDLNISQYISV